MIKITTVQGKEHGKTGKCLAGAWIAKKGCFVTRASFLAMTVGRRQEERLGGGAAQPLLLEIGMKPSLRGGTTKQSEMNN